MLVCPSLSSGLGLDLSRGADPAAGPGAQLRWLSRAGLQHHITLGELRQAALKEQHLELCQHSDNPKDKAVLLRCSHTKIRRRLPSEAATSVRRPRAHRAGTTPWTFGTTAAAPVPRPGLPWCWPIAAAPLLAPSTHPCSRFLVDSGRPEISTCLSTRSFLTFSNTDTAFRAGHN